MNSPAATPDQREIAALVRAINAAWVEGDVEDLGQFFHPAMVIMGPDLTRHGEGREECVRS